LHSNQKRVKVGVIKNLAKVLKILSPDTRKNYLYVLEELQQPKVNWRFRRLIAKQLGDLSEVFSAETVALHILPMALKLQLDPVAAVRKALYPQLGKIIKSAVSPSVKSPGSTPTPSITVHFAPPSPNSSSSGASAVATTTGGVVGSGGGQIAVSPVRSRTTSASQQQQQVAEQRENFMSFIQQLPKNTTYSNRLVFCQLCGHSVGVLEKKLFWDLFLDPILELVQDKVPNVRLATAKALQKIQNHENFTDDERIIRALAELKLDKDPEVIFKAGGIPPARKKTTHNTKNKT